MTKWSISGAKITPHRDAPDSPAGFKYLGRWLDAALSERLSFSLLSKRLTGMLTTLDASPLYGPFKAWVYQHLILPALSWFLMIHDFCMTHVTRLDLVCRKYLKSWWRVPRGGNVAILYSGTRHRVGLRHKRLTTLFKQQQLVRMDLLRCSRDPLTLGVYKVIKDREARGKRRAFRPAQVLEANLRKAQAAASTPKPRAGVGAVAPKLSLRRAATQLVAEEDTASLLFRLNTLQVQGRWLEWSRVMKADMSWSRILRSGTTKGITFAVNATMDTLPTRPNLARWGKTEIAKSCPFCHFPSATIAHILNGCSVAREQGRYTWRHDSVLASIVEVIATKLQEKKVLEPPPFSGFVRGGTLAPESHAHSTSAPAASTNAARPTTGGSFKSLKSALASIPPVAESLLPTAHTKPAPPPKPSPFKRGLLDRASDWELSHDVGGRLHIPFFLHPGTRQRPDILLFSVSARIVILGELTCPLEHRVQISSALKKERYSELVSEMSACGWHVELFTFEVTSKGYTAPSLPFFFRQLGIRLPFARLDTIAQVSLMCSYSIYVHRENPVWIPRPLLNDSLGEIQGQELRKHCCALLASAAGAVAIVSLWWSHPTHTQQVNERTEAEKEYAEAVALVDSILAAPTPILKHGRKRSQEAGGPAAKRRRVTFAPDPAHATPRTPDGSLSPPTQQKKKRSVRADTILIDPSAFPLSPPRTQQTPKRSVRADTVLVDPGAFTLSPPPAQKARKKPQKTANRT